MARVLVTEKIAEEGLDALRASGHDVDVRLGLSPEELLEAIPGAHALIIRSATTVTAEVLDAGTDLVVVGRAGIGLDNVDVAHATTRGVMVVNAPQSNILSAAEQTMALLLAQARNIPQAHSALVAGRWERSKWEGVELADKTLAVVGLGRIGKLVAQRAMAFGMNIIAHDPFVSPDRAAAMNIELVDLEEIAERADFLTLHVARTPETIGMIGTDFLDRAKPGLRIINVARGGIVDEAALAAAIADGRIAGAALDVFEAEPTTESPLFDLPQVVVTPHLGASTKEAQAKAGDTIARQVGLALAGEFVPFAVNIAAEAADETVRPYLAVGEHLGRLFAGLVNAEGLPETIDIEYQGELAGYDTSLLTLSVMKGIFEAGTDESVSFVNAPQLADSLGVTVTDRATSSSVDWINLIGITGGDHQIAGTLVGLKAEPRVVQIDGHTLDVPPSAHLTVVRNDDRPGVIGRVGSILGAANVNIDDMDVGRSAEGASALMVISTGEPVSEELARELATADGIVSVTVINR